MLCVEERESEREGGGVRDEGGKGGGESSRVGVQAKERK